MSHAGSPRRQRYGRRLRRLGLLLVLLVSGASIAGYVVLSLTLNGLPAYRTFPGWVAILQPLSQPSGDDVQLQVLSTAVGDHPLASIPGERFEPGPVRRSAAPRRCFCW